MPRKPRPSRPSRILPLLGTGPLIAPGLEEADIASLSPDPANVRQHDQRSIDAIAASLRRFGQQTPIVVDQHNIVRKGNGTFAAARALKWEKIGIIRTALIGSELTAYTIADNRTGDLSTFDDAALSQILKTLSSEGVDLADLAFTADDLAALCPPVAGQETETTLGAGAGSLTDQYKIVIDCRDEAQQTELLDRFEQEGLAVKALVG